MSIYNYSPLSKSHKLDRILLLKFIRLSGGERILVLTGSRNYAYLQTQKRILMRRKNDELELLYPLVPNLVLVVHMFYCCVSISRPG
jgi:hypothetical protein